MNAPAATGPLILPTARDIRLKLTPICREDPTLGYFGSQEVRRGTTDPRCDAQTFDQRA